MNLASKISFFLKFNAIPFGGYYLHPKQIQKDSLDVMYLFGYLLDFYKNVSWFPHFFLIRRFSFFVVIPHTELIVIRTIGYNIYQLPARIAEMT